MTVKGHVLVASALAYVPIDYIINNYSLLDTVIVYVSIIFGSILPDIDEPNSYIGNKSIFLSPFLKVLGLKHRTLTHWLITPFLVLLIGYLLNNSFSIYMYALAFGILAHDIGDLLTKGGIKGFLFPFFPKVRISLLPRVLRIETFSLTEMFFNFSLLLLNGFLYVKLMEI